MTAQFGREAPQETEAGKSRRILEQTSAKSLQQRKEKLVLAYANPQKLADMLLALGFFKKDTGWRLICPNWHEDYYEPKRVTCEAMERKPCVWNWERVGQNPDCSLDGEFKAGMDEARNLGVRGILEKTVNFTLQEIYGKHAVDIAVSIPEVGRGVEGRVPIAGTVPANKFFALTHKSPARYFLIFDLELASPLKAIRFIHLLLDHDSKTQPILVTLNRDEAVKAVIEGQGIRVHVINE